MARMKGEGRLWGEAGAGCLSGGSNKVKKWNSGASCWWTFMAEW